MMETGQPVSSLYIHTHMRVDGTYIMKRLELFV